MSTTFKNMKKLNADDLKTVLGGVWDYNTLSVEEREEFDRVYGALLRSPYDEGKQDEFLQFAKGLDAKYGTNEM